MKSASIFGTMIPKGGKNEWCSQTPFFGTTFPKGGTVSIFEPNDEKVVFRAQKKMSGVASLQFFGTTFPKGGNKIFSECVKESD